MKALSVTSFLSWRGGWFRSLRTVARTAEPDGLDAFAAEREPGAAASPAQGRAGHRHPWTIGALVVVALAEAPLAGLWLYERVQPQSTAIAFLPQQPEILPAALAARPLVVERIDRIAPGHAARTAAGTPSRTTADDSDRAASSLTVGGWVSIRTPVPMQVFEDDRLVGSTDVDRLMLPVGTRRLEIVSEALGYRSRQDVAIKSGQTSTLRLEMPTGTLAVNAQPWAEVWIDGERVGDTPLGNLTRTIGPHDIVFRHPSLGEKRTTVVVTLKGAARVGVDLRSKS